MKKKRFDVPLLIAVVIPVVITCILVGSFGYAASVKRRFWACVEELSASTVYAYEHDGLKVTNNTETFFVTGDQVYRPYHVITVGGPGKPQRKVPKGKPDLEIDFGDGSKMSLWEVKVKNAKTASGLGLFVCYENPDGKIYRYDTDKIFVSNFNFY